MHINAQNKQINNNAYIYTRGSKNLDRLVIGSATNLMMLVSAETIVFYRISESCVCWSTLTSQSILKTLVGGFYILCIFVDANFGNLHLA